MDDLESLVFSIWYVSNVPMARSNVQPSEGLILSFLDQEAAKARMLVTDKVYYLGFHINRKYFRKNVNILKMSMFMKR